MLGLWLWLWLSSIPLVAHAQAVPSDGFRLDRFGATPTSRDGFAITLPDTLPHLAWSAQLQARYATRPLVLRTPSERAVVAHRLDAELTAALGLLGVLELYARLPLVVVSVGQDARLGTTHFDAPHGPALADSALGMTGQAFSLAGVRVGARAELMLPSGRQSALSGDHAIAPRGHLLASYELWRFTFGLEAGAVYRPPRDYGVGSIGSELEWASAVRFRPVGPAQLSVEMFGTRGLRGRAAPGAADSWQGLLGGRWAIPVREQLVVRVGAALGGGLSDALGEPAFRAMFTLGFDPGDPALPMATRADKPSPDRDGDGLLNERDGCPGIPEDRDGFQDDDGCPDSDDDGDGMPDVLDLCPREAGPRAGCPAQEEASEVNGGPSDRDGDGLSDADDRCPALPEDRDGDHDEDGCPELDRDRDGIPDESDACPELPGHAAQAGCLAHVKRQGDQLVLQGPVRFEPGLAVLDAISDPVLDDVAALLKAEPGLSVRIEYFGRATRKYRILSQVRAEAVLYALMERGVRAERLSAFGQAVDRRNRQERLELRVSAQGFEEARPAPSEPALRPAPAVPPPAGTNEPVIDPEQGEIVPMPAPAPNPAPAAPVPPAPAPPAAKPPAANPPPTRAPKPPVPPAPRPPAPPASSNEPPPDPEQGDH